MENTEFIAYSKAIFRILKQTHNQELCTKLFKVLVITGSMQNILIASNIEKEKYVFAECVRTLGDRGFKVSVSLRRMFVFRNRIAHVNDLINIMCIFNELTVQEIDKEFESVIKLMDYLNPIEFDQVENRIAADSMNIF